MAKFKVWWPDRGQIQDGAPVFVAHDYEDAAAQWADWYDGHTADYSIVGGEDAEVVVESVADGVQVNLTVRGEMTRVYRASQRR